MAEQDDHTNGRYHDDNDPQHPHEVVLTDSVGRAALWSWLGPLVALSIIAGLLLLYWSTRGPGATEEQRRENPITATSGDVNADDSHAGDLTHGGGDPAPNPSDTTDQLKDRGAGSKDSGLSGVQR